MAQSISDSFSSKLPGLNGLRAIAALLVLFRHVYGIAALNGDTNVQAFSDRINNIGQEMVNLFFVISGFIITHILIKEEKANGTISIKNFYIKRFLRIWPIYFLLIAITLLFNQFTDLFLLYGELNSNSLLLLVFFLATLQPFFSSISFSVLPHYWSLSVEEQFYIFWPLLFKYVKSINKYLIPILIIIGMIAIRNASAYMARHTANPVYVDISRFLLLSKFSSIAIGVIGAFLFNDKAKLIFYFNRPIVQVLSWILFIFFLVSNYNIPYVHFEFTSFVYLVIILNVINGEKTIISTENKLLNWLGTISYGLYMYHWIVIPLIVELFKRTGIWQLSIQSSHLLLLFVSTFCVVIISHISYKYYEKYFLKMKSRLV